MKNIPDKLGEEIIQFYKENEISISSLAKKFKLKKGDIKVLLKKNKIAIIDSREEKIFDTSYFIPYKIQKIDFIFAGIAFFVALFTYYLTMTPSVAAGDAGELTSALFFLGVAHPSGYPLYCIVGKFFCFIMPFEWVATRVNFLSVFFGALTISLVYFPTFTTSHSIGITPISVSL